MSATNSAAPTVTYGDLSFDIHALPAQSLAALLRKGLAHYLGNEQASKVTSWKASEEGKNASDDLVAAKRAEFVAAAVKSINDGTVGANLRGPRGTPVETVMRRIAEAELKVNLAKIGVKMPKGTETVDLKGADGQVTSFTRVAMIDRRLAHATHGPRIRKAADKELAALAKQAEAGGTAEGADVLDI